MRISVYIAATFDGLIARDDGDVSWLDKYNQDPAEDYGFGSFFASVDGLVMGRKTFEKVLSFDEWGYVGKRVVVLSHSEVAIPEDLTSSVECMSGSPIEIVERLSQRGFEHLYIDGGATIRGFLAAKLVDTLILTRVPLVLGSGISLFGDLAQEIPLQHIATQPFPNGLVQSEYRIARTNAEQGGADQPATAPKSKAQGKEKPKPESEVRPQ
jgi:dihydrofolate reductase